MNYSEKELVNMFKTGTVTSYNKDAGRGIITDETGEEYVILANNIVKTHTTQFLEKMILLSSFHTMVIPQCSRQELHNH